MFVPLVLYALAWLCGRPSLLEHGCSLHPVKTDRQTDRLCGCRALPELSHPLAREDVPEESGPRHTLPSSSGTLQRTVLSTGKVGGGPLAGWDRGEIAQETPGPDGTCLCPHRARAERQDPSSKFAGTHGRRIILRAFQRDILPSPGRAERGGSSSPLPPPPPPPLPGEGGFCHGGMDGRVLRGGGVGVGAEPGAHELAFQVPEREPRSIQEVGKGV